MKINHIFVIFLFYPCFFNSENDCKVSGESSVFLFGYTSFFFQCRFIFNILEVGFINMKDEEIKLIDFYLGYVEQETFYNKYLLDFGKNILHLMNIDEKIINYKIFFKIRSLDFSIKIFYSFPIVILTEELNFVKATEKIKRGRYFASLYVFQLDRQSVINFKNLENQFYIKFIKLGICHSNDGCNLYPIDGKKRNIEFYKNIFELTDKTITLNYMHSSISDISICFTYKKDLITMVSSIYYIIHVPINILKVEDNFVYWSYNLIDSYFIIYYCTPFRLIPVQIGSCDHKNSVLNCKRTNGLSQIFGQLTPKGLEIKSLGINHYYFKITLCITRNSISTSINSSIFLDLSMVKKQKKDYDIIGDFENIKLVFDKSLARATGILNASLIDVPNYTINQARFSSFTSRNSENEYKICDSFGDGIIEYVSPFSFYLLICQEKYITFFEIDEIIFNNLIITKEIKISKDFILSIKSDIYTFNVKNKESLAIDRLIENKRFIYIKHVMEFIPENIIELDISEKIYTIISACLIVDKFNAVENLIEDESYSLHIESSKFNLKKRNIFIDGDPSVFETMLLVLLISDGKNIFFQSTKPFKTNKNIIEFFKIVKNVLKWRISLEKYNLKIKVAENTEFYYVGECFHKIGCRLYENKYVSELYTNQLTLSLPIRIPSLKLMFAINPLFTSTQKNEIVIIQEINLSFHVDKRLYQQRTTLPLSSTIDFKPSWIHMFTQKKRIIIITFSIIYGLLLVACVWLVFKIFCNRNIFKMLMKKKIVFKNEKNESKASEDC